MAGAKDKISVERSLKSADSSDRPGSTDVNARGMRRSPGKATGDDVGKALRDAFEKTVNEDIPQDFLDLLSRLN